MQLLLLLLILNAAYIAAFPSPTIFYMGNVVLHLALGLLLTVLFLRKFNRESAILLAAAIPALYLVVRGNTTDHRTVLYIHVALGALFVILLVTRLRTKSLIVATALLALLPIYRFTRPTTAHIRNPDSAPLSMNQEGAGEHSPFAPSSAQTTTGNIIPSNFFMDSEQCGNCHHDIYQQWKSSMHHFASFNNQFYRRSIEYMQDHVGTRPSKWCAGCHDHAVFFNGRFDRPIKEQVDTPEAQAGLGCMSCHSIVHVASTMGNADFTVNYPPLHELASSHNKYIQAVDSFLTYLNPEPHRQTFMKPFMRQPEFCAACHKVHLDLPVNNYRWARGFNDYDNWQASGVSGQGARSFYYPAKTSACADCHMPLVPSKDPGNKGGQIHSHRFPAANTAVAYVNHDQAQLEAEEKFLKSGFITVDIFAITSGEDATGKTAMQRRSDTVQANTQFAQGEEVEQPSGGIIRDVGKVAAPIDASGAAVEPGSTARVDVVVRTRKIGHFFPAGTVDAFDIWLELQASDATGKVVYWSGKVEDNGKGPVDPGAHFYRSYQLDGEANPINKRNAWQARSLLYVRLIPPGAADVCHYLVKVPKDAKGPIRFNAKLNYRKFSHFYTHFAYENRGPAPDLPIVTLADAHTTIALGKPTWQPVVRRQDRERWNDWGIGLLLQGDLKGAEYAFNQVTKAEPTYADGWLNVARALIQEGETERAKPFLDKSLSIDPSLGRIYFFKAAIQRADGDYDGALKSLETARAKYPRDRVVLNQIARILFLKRDYTGALQALKQVNDVDPEDVQMHYTAMLCYRGLGKLDAAAREEILFRRFKADESSQAITLARRLASPEDNNERQPIHNHE